MRIGRGNPSIREAHMLDLDAALLAADLKRMRQEARDLRIAVDAMAEARSRALAEVATWRALALAGLLVDVGEG